MEFDPFIVRRAISFAGHEEIVESTAKFHMQVALNKCSSRTRTYNKTVIENTSKMKIIKDKKSERKITSCCFQESQETEEVKIFEFLNWEIKNKFPTSPKIMVKMIEHVHDWRKTRNTDGPILVVSV